MATITFFDANDDYWSDVIVNCAFPDLLKEIHERTYFPLAVCQGEFTKFEKPRHIWEKEIYALKEALRRGSEFVHGANGALLCYSDSAIERIVYPVFSPNDPVPTNTSMATERFYTFIRPVLFLRVVETSGLGGMEHFTRKGSLLLGPL